jgi:hypothetical protein
MPAASEQALVSARCNRKVREICATDLYKARETNASNSSAMKGACSSPRVSTRSIRDIDEKAKNRNEKTRHPKNLTPAPITTKVFAPLHSPAGMLRRSGPASPECADKEE